MNKTNSTLHVRMLLRGVFSCLLLGLIGLAQAQETRTITGRVISRSTGDPIQGISVLVKGTTNSVSGTENGSFSIKAKTGDLLVFTSVGHVTREIKLGTASSLEVRLEEDYNNLEDVVVIGYGKMKKTDLSSSQVTVTAEEMNRTVNTTFDQALQGRAANVYVTSNSGQPGAAPSVLIRGSNSINFSNQPLYVIDGVQFKPGNPSGANFLGGISPDDIETMNVLQGPSATSIYGAAGANGVIMITTKRGKSGETKISYNSLFTMQDTPEYVPVMNLREYATFRNAFAAAGGAAATPEFEDPSVLGEGSNWQNALFRRTMLNKQQLSLSGGTDKTNFYFSGEYFNQEGVARGSGFQRYSVRLNLDNQTRKWLKIGTNISVNQTREEINISNGDILNIAISQNPSVPITNPDGSWGGPTETQFQISNPIALAEINDNRNKSMSFVGGVYADITLLKGLVFHNEVNSYFSYNNNYRFNPSYQFGGFVNDLTRSSREASNSYWWGLQQRLQYEKRVGKHNFSVMAAHEAQENGSENLSGLRENYVSNSIQELSGGDAETAQANSGKNAGAKESFFGRVHYSYNDRYILQYTNRWDGSSNFGADKRWGSFPAFSAAWRASEENFMKGAAEWMNELKFRVEYGLSGNENAAGYWASLQAVPTAWGTGFLPERFNNPLLGWEVSKTFNVGVDLHLFNNRVELIADVYQKKIEDLLTVNDYPYYSGGDISYSAGYIQFPTTNIGSMRNKGFGITLNTVNIQQPFTWKTGFNISVDRNEVTDLFKGTPIISTFGTSTLQINTRMGSPMGMLTGYIAEGLFTSYKEIQEHAIQTSTTTHVIDPIQGTWVGDVKFKDVNKDGYINQDDRVVIANPWPKFSFGFNNFFSYKNVDLNMFFTGVSGNDIVNYTRYRFEQPAGAGVGGNNFKSVANFARPSSTTAGDQGVSLVNPGYGISRIAPGDPNGNNRITQWHVEDGSYIRLKNIQVSYSLPKRIIGRTPLKGLKLGVNVQNLFTITNYKGFDPEVGMVNNGAVMMAGVDNGRYPSVRMYSFNLMADF